MDVQAAITQASRLLPQGMPTPPTFTKVNPADQPILYLALTSTTLPPWTLDEYAETRVAQRISMVSRRGAGAGARRQKYAVHAQMDPHALAARQIGINEVETALRNWNVNLPTGIDHRPAARLHAAGQRPADERRRSTRPMVVAYRDGSPVRLEELGTIIDSVEDDKTASWFYTQRRRAARHHARHPAAARHQHHRGRPTASRTLLPQFRTELPPVGPHGHPLRPLRHDPRILSTTCSSPCC